MQANKEIYLPTDDLITKVRKTNLHVIGEINKLDVSSWEHWDRGFIATVVMALTLVAAKALDSSMVPGVLIAAEALRQYLLARKNSRRARDKSAVLAPYIEISQTLSENERFYGKT